MERRHHGNVQGKPARRRRLQSKRRYSDILRNSEAETKDAGRDLDIEGDVVVSKDSGLGFGEETKRSQAESRTRPSFGRTLSRLTNRNIR